MDILVDLRKSKDISQGKMAQILGITQQAYCNYEKGIRQLPDELKIKIADYYGISVDYLLGREFEINENNTNIKIAHNLINLRKQLKITQQQVATKIGISQQTYAAYENGTRTPPTDILTLLADYYKVTTDFLLNRNDKINNEETKLLNLFSTLSNENKLKVIEYIEFLQYKEKNLL